MSDRPARKRPAPAGTRGEAKELADHVSGWLNAVADALDDAAETTGLAEPVRKNPYAALGAAVGVGYVLGGGLLSPTTGRVLRLGLKLATLPAVQTRLLDLAEATLDGVLEQGKKKKPPPAGGA